LKPVVRSRLRYTGQHDGKMRDERRNAGTTEGNFAGVGAGGKHCGAGGGGGVGLCDPAAGEHCSVLSCAVEHGDVVFRETGGDCDGGGLRGGVAGGEFDERGYQRVVVSTVLECVCGVGWVYGGGALGACAARAGEEGGGDGGGEDGGADRGGGGAEAGGGGGASVGGAVVGGGGCGAAAAGARYS